MIGELQVELYHGTISICAENIVKNGILLNKGKPKVDFGRGFYTTPSYNFAKSTAINKADKTNAYYTESYVFPYVLKYTINEEYFKLMNKLEFERDDTNWAQFIVNNRNGIEYMRSINCFFHNIRGKYDIVKGGIADNQITLLVKELLKSRRRVSVTDLSNILYAYPTSQISFHTKRSLSCIELVSCDIIKPTNMKGDAVNE